MFVSIASMGKNMFVSHLLKLIKSYKYLSIWKIQDERKYIILNYSTTSNIYGERNILRILLNAGHAQPMNLIAFPISTPASSYLDQYIKIISLLKKTSHLLIYQRYPYLLYTKLHFEN
jgi:hypothetical protein